MLDLAIAALACLGMLAVPFAFLEYVRIRVRHALKNQESHRA
jgi:hypothetical protein